MRTLFSVTVGVLALLGSAAAAPPPAVVPLAPAVQPAAAAPAGNLYALDAGLSTVVDHPAEFAGQLVRLRSVRVEQVLSPTLVKLKEAREHGPYHFHTFYYPDELLAVLPAGTRVASGDVMIVAGAVRTVRGAALTKETVGTHDDILKHGSRPVLIAASATTIDGVRMDAAR